MAECLYWCVGAIHHSYDDLIPFFAACNFPCDFIPCRTPPPPQPQQAVYRELPADKLREYEGEYTNGAYGSLFVELNETSIELRFSFLDLHGAYHQSTIHASVLMMVLQVLSAL